jgi:hypothetical protein
MYAELQQRAAFYLAGRPSGLDDDAVAELGMRPALFAGYRDLTRLRYDFPLVLVKESPDGAIAEPLSRLIDRVLDEVALAGNDGARLRSHALSLECELNSMAARGARGSLPELLAEAARRLAPGNGSDLFADSVRRLQATLKVEGELVDCDASLPARLSEHAWRVVQRRKAAAFRKNIDRLILALNEILRGDAARSEAGRMPATLKAAVGAAYEEAFDFEQLSRLLRRTSAASPLTATRREAIESTLHVLRSQRFCVAPGGDVEQYRFQFDNCTQATAACRNRLAAMAELVRAMTAAELEIDGAPGGPRLDALTRRLGDHGLDVRDRAQFPDYLVCINARDLQAMEYDELMQMYASGLPMKVLVQTDDLLPAWSDGASHAAFGARSRQLASAAIGMNEVFVLQSASSNLVRCRDRILGAMNYSGPALISVFSGASGHAGDLPPYLIAAAAMESRAFPAFSYDPSAGRDWASRFAIDDNPQVGRDWPLHEFAFEDAEHQRRSEEVELTLMDFVACDRRYARHFAPVAPAHWSEALAPVGNCLDGEGGTVPDQFPSLLMVDRDNTLQRVIVDASLIQEARRCRDAWRSLQELGGIHNSHAEKLLARERQSREAARTDAAAATTSATPGDAEGSAKTMQTSMKAVAPASASVATAAAPSAESQAEHASGDPYIETARCSSCNECIQLNNKMFAYDANQQARIVDPDAGTYRELVEAAESCQVAVIHPGKPRNPAESGLEELVKRAEPFL